MKSRPPAYKNRLLYKSPDGSAFETNNHARFISKSITDVSGEELKLIFKDTRVKVLIGCAPCQPFSSYNYKGGKQTDQDKWKLLYEFSRLIKEVLPEIVSMENVVQLLNFDKAPVFKDFINELNDLGYHVHYEIVNCPDYGIPQRRKRLVLLASRLGEICIVAKTHTKENYKTVKDAIGHLPNLNDGESCEKDSLHFARKLNQLNRERIRSTPYGGSWKDWPENLKLKCHLKDSGKTYPSVYGRMRWEEPAPTMTTQCIGYGNGRFGHPVQNRAISLREAALFQTFPIDYKFFDDKKKHFSSTEIARHIGNAVPVRLGEIIANSIKEHLCKIQDYEN